MTKKYFTILGQQSKKITQKLAQTKLKTERITNKYKTVYLNRQINKKIDIKQTQREPIKNFKTFWY